MKKKLLAKLAATIYSGYMASGSMHRDIDDCLLMAESLIEQIDEKYPDEDPFDSSVGEVFDADLKRVFDEPSEKIMDQDSFDKISDLRPFLLRHPDSNMVTESCLHYLGDDAQKWWERRTEKKGDEIHCSCKSVDGVFKCDERIGCTGIDKDFFNDPKKGFSEEPKGMTLQEAIRYSRGTGGMMTRYSMRDKMNHFTVKQNDLIRYGKHYYLTVEDIMANDWVPVE